MIVELQIKKYHVFFEDLLKPAFGCSRDEAGVFYVKFHRLRMSVYGRKFNSMWR